MLIQNLKEIMTKILIKIQTQFYLVIKFAGCLITWFSILKTRQLSLSTTEDEQNILFNQQQHQGNYYQC
jgi:hypothetical protein